MKVIFLCKRVCSLCDSGWYVYETDNVQISWNLCGGRGLSHPAHHFCCDFQQDKIMSRISQSLLINDVLKQIATACDTKQAEMCS